MSPSQRPPRWWPEGEQWPPRHRGPPLHLLRFFWIAILAWIGFAVLAGALLGGAPAHPWGFFGLLLLIGFLAVIFSPRRWWGMGVGRRLRELTEAARRLEATDARRRTFLAELAHELRTPLAVVRAQAEAIADGVYPGDAAHLAPVLDATATMEALVADLRTLAESEAGALTLSRAPVAVDDLLAESAAPYRAAADAKGVGVEVQPAAGVPPIDGDAARLRRALGNLVANALDHTPPAGRVTLRAERAGLRVAVTVADTGEGMEPELARRAFERFAKAPGSRGSGLGLSIARDIVEAHGGTISLESSPGSGTTVRLLLPVAT